MIYFETLINWRIARQRFRTPTGYIEATGLDNTLDYNDFVFIPQDKNRDVIAIRNWLHHDDNSINGYQMIGCYETAPRSQRVTLLGIKFVFVCGIDAAYFRLRWLG